MTDDEFRERVAALPREALERVVWAGRITALTAKHLRDDGLEALSRLADARREIVRLQSELARERLAVKEISETLQRVAGPLDLAAKVAAETERLREWYSKPNKEWSHALMTSEPLKREESFRLALRRRVLELVIATADEAGERARRDLAKLERARAGRVAGAEKTNRDRQRQLASREALIARRVRRAARDEDGGRKSARQIERETGVDRRKVAKILKG